MGKNKPNRLSQRASNSVQAMTLLQRFLHLHQLQMEIAEALHKLTNPKALAEAVAIGELSEQERQSLLWALGTADQPSGTGQAAGTTANLPPVRRRRLVAAPRLTGHPLDEE